MLPFADILAWCLMPNHFHLMVHVNHVEIELPPSAKMSFNNSIGIMLASYTGAINNQQNWSGSLFRSETKATCLTDVKGISPGWIVKMGITEFIIDNHDIEYPNACFNYILFNPVKDRLVKKPGDWEFSSFLDLIDYRKGNLINRNRIQEFGLNITRFT